MKKEENSLKQQTGGKVIWTDVMEMVQMDHLQVIFVKLMINSSEQTMYSLEAQHNNQENYFQLVHAYVSQRFSFDQFVNFWQFLYVNRQ